MKKKQAPCAVRAAHCTPTSIKPTADSKAAAGSCWCFLCCTLQRASPDAPYLLPAVLYMRYAKTKSRHGTTHASIAMGELSACLAVARAD